jgi:HD-GYP domain-containing protein (c-di-GMP phosphodiesterase class II)
VTCEECAARFTFQEQGNQYGLVERREIKEKEERYDAYKTAQTELLNSAQAKEVITRFISLLESQRSVAAIHRLLQSHRLVYESYGTFVKKWKGAEAWVESYIAYHPEALSELARMVGLEGGRLSEAVSRLKRLWSDYQRPLTFFGGPLFDISRHC